MVERCQGTTKGGRPCGAKPLPGAALCPWHSPDWAGRRAEWSAKGGANRSNTVRAKKVLPDHVLDMSEVQGLLCVALKGVLTGKVEAGVGNAAANLARAIATVSEAASFEEQLADLRRQVTELKGA